MLSQFAKLFVLYYSKGAHCVEQASTQIIY